MRNSKIQKYAQAFKKLSASSSRDQLVRLYSGAKKVHEASAETNDSTLINKANGLFQVASRLLWNADNHGVTASFFAEMLGRLNSLSNDISAYTAKQLKNPFGAGKFVTVNSALNTFNTFLSRTLPVNLSAFKAKVPASTKDPVKTPSKGLSLEDRILAEESGQHPSGVLGMPPFQRTIPGPGGTRVNPVDMPAAPEGAAFEKGFDWTPQSKIKTPPKYEPEFPKSQEEKDMESWYVENE